MHRFPVCSMTLPPWPPVYPSLRGRVSAGWSGIIPSADNPPEPAPWEASSRRVARQPRHAVEIGVVTGEVGQAVRLHHCNNQGIVTEQASLLADHRARGDLRGRDG